MLEDFMKDLKITPIWENKWKLAEEYNYTIKDYWMNLVISIPKGFIFDGASIPRIFYIIWTPMSTDTIVAALIHDYLYKTQKTSRGFSDRVFLKIMEMTDVSIIKRILYYVWVRIWGWVSWLINKKALHS